ncbi:hypothetical protein GGR16_002536 [Chelatococcus caeni]|uniref:Tripartite tricarboxylate transporter TctB family protein n=1 Tax=Chelatococcus caeni TaxID=1348468 RepID=A0A840C528_9HYPH|nr:hypothetical protein [Chelatococcus caeni]MBB4017507.1 hypothetical protein [Chelatococcus caeni]
MSRNDQSVPGLRKADFWTGLVLVAISVFMLVETLGYPLEGSYAGVRNAWYVSPALLPLIVSAFLILLSCSLLATAVRAGAASAALADVTPRALRGHAGAARDIWIVAFVLGGYIYCLVPYVDFTAATALTLLTLAAAYHLPTARVRKAGLAVFACAIAAVLLATFAAGWRPQPRSTGADLRDLAVWAAFLAAAVSVAWAAGAPERRRWRRCLVVALGTSLILSVVFKWGLLVPLPVEGVTINTLDAARRLLLLR